MSNCTALWLPVPRYEGFYEVSSRGEVRSLDRQVRSGGGWRVALGQPLKAICDKHGYLCVYLSRESRIRTCKIHLLVLEAFAGPRPPGMVARHGPGGRHDNRWPENLCWGTQHDNIGPDRERDGTAILGSANPLAKLAESAVRDCRDRYAAGGITYRQLAAEHGVGIRTMGDAITGRTWRHVP